MNTKTATNTPTPFANRKRPTEGQVREALYSEFSDTFKAVNGVRPRHVGKDDLTLDDLASRIARLNDDLARDRAEYAAELDAHLAETAAYRERMARQAAEEADRAVREYWMDRAAARDAAGW